MARCEEGKNFTLSRFVVMPTWESRIIEFGFEFELEFELELDFELEFELDFELEYIKIQQTEYFVMFDKRDQSVLSFIEWCFFSFFFCVFTCHK